MAGLGIRHQWGFSASSLEELKNVVGVVIRAKSKIGRSSGIGGTSARVFRRVILKKHAGENVVDGTSDGNGTSVQVFSCCCCRNH